MQTFIAPNLFVSLIEKGPEAGDFSDGNPNGAFMEVGMNWFLNHRCPQQLKELAIEAGAKDMHIVVRSEQAGVNIFPHLKQQ